MYYIQTISSISNQNSFRNEDLYSSLREFDSENDVVAPDYKEFIPRNALRRLSPILRMGLTCAMECQKNTSEEFDSIVVGTALGCLKDTEKFLTNFITTTSDFLSPTAFIQSTHNTIGGQISLGLKNHSYNMTHTQNNLSFEVSLIDAILCINDGKKNVLVGAAEEKIPFMEHIQPDIVPNDFPLASGASFFVLTDDKKEIGIKKVEALFNVKSIENEIKRFLNEENLSENDIDLVLTSNDVPLDFKKTINYLDYSGLHYSASAFSTHIGHDYLKKENSKNVLIINNLCNDKLGLILLQKG